jgi:DNA-binding NarL/FixJ family response regulator
MKVLVADDHSVFRQGLRLVLGGLAPEVDIIEAGDFGEATGIAEATPDLGLILLDLRMPAPDGRAMDGFDGLRALRRVLPRVPIMVLSASEDSADVFRSLECGASGYLAKSAPAATMLEALRLVLVGGIYVPRDLVAGGAPVRPQSPGDEPAATLTPRQHEVLSLIADGLSNKEIAYRLGTSEGTVKAHITAIMRSLGARNRVQMLLAAERRGIKLRDPKLRPGA